MTSEQESAGSFNDGYVQLMYEDFLANPESVTAEWRKVFANGPVAGAATSSPGNGNGSSNGAGTAVVAPPSGNGVPAAPAAPARATQAAPAAGDLPEGATLLRGPAAGLVKNMNESLTVPTATTFRVLPMSRIWTERATINKELDGSRKLSFTHLVAWALILANREFPVMSHSFENIGGKPYRVVAPHCNFGLAVDVEKPDGSRGLMVPVVHAAEAGGPVDFFDRYDALVKQARAGKLALDDMLGTTLTLTNPGGLGTVASVPRLMAHTGTIIATGAIDYPAEYRHLSKDEIAKLGIGKVMTMTSTYDHRVIQGAESGAFLKLVDELLQGGHQFYEQVRGGLGLAGGITVTPPAGLAAPGAAGAKPAAAATPPAAAPATAAPVATTIVPAALSTSAPEAVPALDAGERPPTPGPGGDHGDAILLEPGAEMHDVHESLLPEPPSYKSPATQVISGTHADQLASVAAAMSLVKAHRTHGHLVAQLDPLGSEPIGDPALDPATVGLNEEILRTIPASVLRIGVEGETLADALPRLRDKYCGTIAYEIEHIADHEQRTWLRRMIEAGEHRRPLTDEERTRLLDRLTDVEVFERFVRRAYLAQKQFSIEGLDMMVPMLDETLELAAEGGASEVVLGMAHRGRLNVLTHILGRPYAHVLKEFEAVTRVVDGTELPNRGTGDVKYHQGATSEVQTPRGTLSVTLENNPSHLEIVNPVVVGHARATQSLKRGHELHHDPTASLPVMIHGDAAFAGQGISQETLNLQALVGYSTGGTMHIIANNQLGFTAEPDEGRSTRYASDLAKGFDMPIIHVNADDPEACLAAVRLALAFRNRFRRDAMIDLIGYRRWGHNETDEPAYTQPRMYAKIKDHPRVRDLFAAKLEQSGIVTAEQVKARYDERYKAISAIHDEVLKIENREAFELVEEPSRETIADGSFEEPSTPIDEARVRDLSARLHDVPDGFTVHPKLAKQLDKRAEMPDHAFDWGAAEALAYGSLLQDGRSIRITGQDTGRGTFAHRHAMLHDVNTGEIHVPLQHLTDARGTFEIHNSPLSENGCLGFEYGYSTAAPDSLVIWEAQFGDFVNGAQVVLDQFITSGYAKWGQTTRLTLLLPHGYQGDGPEHSNARLTTFLNAAAEGNIRVANCTTSGQFFHLMRRQGTIGQERPLIVMTPKGLLRAPQAMSPLSEITGGRFEWVLDDPAFAAADADRSKVRRVVFCSGKVFYDIAAKRAADSVEDVAVVRVELLYPFPQKQIANILATYPNATDVVWAQEEPLNYGPFPFMLQRLPRLLGSHQAFSYSGRPRRSSPSEGYSSVHAIEQERVAADALGLS